MENSKTGPQPEKTNKHGLPCIAFDCPFGPAGVIKDGICGYLIEDNDIEQYAKKLSLLIDREISRNHYR